MEINVDEDNMKREEKIFRRQVLSELREEKKEEEDWRERAWRDIPIGSWGVRRGMGRRRGSANEEVTSSHQWQ